MTPDQVFIHLQRLASNIEKNQDRSEAFAGIKQIISALEHEDTQKKIASQILQLAREEVELSYWDSEEGHDVDAAYDHAHHKDKPEELESALKLVKRKIDKFISEVIAQPQPQSEESPF